jgi:hypothetical protein
MKRSIFGIAAGVAVVIVACSNSSSSPTVCPDETTVGSGAACSTAGQRCAGSVDVGACSGQSATIAEYECACTSGAWTCPKPAAPTCPADAGTDAETEDGATDAPTTDAPSDAAEGSIDDDAAPDAPSEAAPEDDAGDAASD